MRRTRLSSAVVGVFLLLVPGTAQAQSAGDFGVAVMSDVMVAMRDGVPMATDVYLPARHGVVVAGRYPTILTRTPYNKDGSERTGRYYASHGYAFVAQDTRGRYKSEGVWHMLDDDGRDGYDAVQWITEQAWSNGKVGMIGTSYVGGTQHAVALEKAPGLETIIPVDAMSNLGHASMRNGRCLRASVLELDVLASSSREPSVPGSGHGGSARGDGSQQARLFACAASSIRNHAHEARVRVRRLGS